VKDESEKSDVMGREAKGREDSGGEIKGGDNLSDQFRTV